MEWVYDDFDDVSTWVQMPYSHYLPESSRWLLKMNQAEIELPEIL